MPTGTSATSRRSTACSNTRTELGRVSAARSDSVGCPVASRRARRRRRRRRRWPAGTARTPRRTRSAACGRAARGAGSRTATGVDAGAEPRDPASIALISDANSTRRPTCGVVQRLDAEVVTGEHEPRPASAPVEDGQRPHAVEAGEAVGAPLGVGVQHTSVSQLVWKVWPSGFELGPQLAEVVDLAVVGELHRAVVGADGWWPPAGSMMPRRRNPRLARSVSKNPSSSGPRWACAAVIASSSAGREDPRTR